jgi:hypothetical protein
MKKKSVKALTLSRETLRRLVEPKLSQAAGGVVTVDNTCYPSCGPHVGCTRAIPCAS